MRTLRTIAVVACLLALLPAALWATTFESKKDLHISNLHQIDDDLYVFGEKLQMDGSIAGDLLVFCYDARMAGTVAGSANFFCRTVRQSGTVLHSLRTFSETAIIEGNITGSYLGIGSRVDVGKGAIIERDMNVYAADADIEGLVRGKATIRGARVTIAGTIEGDVFIHAEKITIIPPAIIRGALVYESAKQDILDTTSGVIIAGGVTWQQPKKEEKKEGETSGAVRTVVLELAALLAAFIFGLIFVIVFRPYAVAAVDQLTRRTSAAFAVGLLSAGVLLLAVIALIIASFMAIAGTIMVGSSTLIVGAIILIFGAVVVPISGFVAISGAVIFYIAKIVVAFVIGALVMRQARSDGGLSRTALLVGLIITTALCAIPYIGWLFWLAVALFGAGAIVLGIRSCRAQMPSVVDGATAETMPPPAS